MTEINFNTEYLQGPAELSNNVRKEPVMGATHIDGKETIFQQRFWIPSLVELGNHKHTGMDEYLKVESGQAIITMQDEEDSEGEEHKLNPGESLVVPTGKWHTIVNRGNNTLEMLAAGFKTGDGQTVRKYPDQ